MAEKSASPDRAVAVLARRQHGVASIRQLRSAGLSDDAVLGRVRASRLHRMHQGVYGIGHPALTPEARWMAAVLACGQTGKADDRHGSDADMDAAATEFDDRESMAVLDCWAAALSHRSAACLWGLLPAGEGPVDVSIQGTGGRRKRKGIRLHRSHLLLPAAVTSLRGIPVTTPARTISDLRRAAPADGRRGIVSAKELRRAIRQADVLGLPIGSEADRDRTRSDLERDFLRLCRRHRLPVPAVNAPVGPYLVDFLWRDRMLVVETDGYRYHRGRAAFEDDRERDLELRARGHEVIRLTEKQVSDDPERVAEILRSVFLEGGTRSRGREPRARAHPPEP